VNAYRRNVVRFLTELLAPVAPVDRALDFGAGDGWFAHELERSGLIRRVVGAEVLRRRGRRFVEPILYDGRRLPFADRSFDLVYAVDVLHHTPDPPAALREALRCCRSHFVLKDHTHTSRLGRWTLALLDEVGNRRFGVPSLYRYQRDWEWLPVIEDAGFALEELHHPVVCERRPVLSWFVNEFQFVGRWRRGRSG
jgi:SAM-dependent methyltransferase